MGLYKVSEVFKNGLLQGFIRVFDGLIQGIHKGFLMGLQGSKGSPG